MKGKLTPNTSIRSNVPSMWQLDLLPQMPAKGIDVSSSLTRSEGFPIVPVTVGTAASLTCTSCVYDIYQKKYLFTKMLTFCKKKIQSTQNAYKIFSWLLFSWKHKLVFFVYHFSEKFAVKVKLQQQYIITTVSSSLELLFFCGQ